MDYKTMALIHAEKIGVYEYTVKGNIMRWISYYGSEGYVNVKYNLDTHEEIRKMQNSTKKSYNYFCG